MCMFDMIVGATSTAQYLNWSADANAEVIVPANPRRLAIAAYNITLGQWIYEASGKFANISGNDPGWTKVWTAAPQSVYSSGLIGADSVDVSTTPLPSGSTPAWMTIRDVPWAIGADIKFNGSSPGNTVAVFEYFYSNEISLELIKFWDQLRQQMPGVK